MTAIQPKKAPRGTFFAVGQPVVVRASGIMPEQRGTVVKSIRSVTGLKFVVSIGGIETVVDSRLLRKEVK